MSRMILASVAAVLFASVSAFGGNEAATVAAIKSANNAMATVTADFAQTKTISASGRVVKSSGTLYYTDKGQLSMQYSSPAGETLVINEGRMFVKRSGKGNTFDTSRNKLMGSLSATLLNCIAGNVEAVAEANDADISVREISSAWVVSISARKQGVKGYSKITLNYRKSDYVLVRMDILEFAGIENVYEMTNVRKGSPIEDSRFDIPKK